MRDKWHPFVGGRKVIPSDEDVQTVSRLKVGVLNCVTPVCFAHGCWSMDTSWISFGIKVGEDYTAGAAALCDAHLPNNNIEGTLLSEQEW